VQPHEFAESCKILRIIFFFVPADTILLWPILLIGYSTISVLLAMLLLSVTWVFRKQVERAYILSIFVLMFSILLTIISLLRYVHCYATHVFPVCSWRFDRAADYIVIPLELLAIICQIVYVIVLGKIWKQAKITGTV
jgi:lysylphosphatidylglycerol synthetase-like protein (DUF2156 family)